MEVRAGGSTSIINHVSRFLSVDVRDVRLAYVSVLFVRTVFPPDRRWSGGTTTTILWKFHCEFVSRNGLRAYEHAQEVTRPGAVNMTRKEHGERYVPPQRCVYLFTCTGGNGRKPVFTWAPKRHRRRRCRAGHFSYSLRRSPTAAINTHARACTRRGIAKLWRQKNSKKKRVSFSARGLTPSPLQPPPSYPYAAIGSAVFRPQPNGRFSRFRHVDRHTDPTTHGRPTSVKPNRNHCAFNTLDYFGYLIILKNYRYRFVRRTHLNVDQILKTCSPNDLRPLKFHKNVNTMSSYRTNSETSNFKNFSTVCDWRLLNVVHQNFQQKKYFVLKTFNDMMWI